MCICTNTVEYHHIFRNRGGCLENSVGIIFQLLVGSFQNIRLHEEVLDAFYLEGIMCKLSYTLHIKL